MPWIFPYFIDIEMSEASELDSSHLPGDSDAGGEYSVASSHDFEVSDIYASVGSSWMFFFLVHSTEI